MMATLQVFVSFSQMMKQRIPAPAS
ncbi:BnaCnng22190D [Brassica napus]|uniref:BnaCnng22190D protein n=1 Tax=Brassica napus TaxID=3708 RepID=A0A078IR65_BRANA|nr:BnaCnng22190D [Brassica napus]